MKVKFYRHGLSARDAAGMLDVLDSDFLTTGRVAKAVEQQLARYFGAPYALLTNSWTNGALALFLALDLKPGDEVVIPAMTFIASANVVVLAGGAPVFADVDPATLLMTPQAVDKAITDRTRAVMPVHLYGQMCDMQGIADVVAQHGGGSSRIVIVEDGAHCFEGTRDGERPGTRSDAAVFSFYATKNVTCGEGGAIVTANEELFRRTMETRLHGMSALAVDRFAGGRYNHWDMARLGTKANLPDLLAALLPDQIAAIDARLPLRQALADRYREAFGEGPLRLVAPVCGGKSAEHLFAIGVPGGQRDNAIRTLNEAGIGVTVNYRAVTETSYYKSRFPTASAACPVSRQWGEETLCLPLYPGLTGTEQEYVIDTVRRAVCPLI